MYASPGPCHIPDCAQAMLRHSSTSVGRRRTESGQRSACGRPRRRHGGRDRRVLRSLPRRPGCGRDPCRAAGWCPLPTPGAAARRRQPPLRGEQREQARRHARPDLDVRPGRAPGPARHRGHLHREHVSGYVHGVGSWSGSAACRAARPGGRVDHRVRADRAVPRLGGDGLGTSGHGWRVVPVRHTRLGAPPAAGGVGVFLGRHPSGVGGAARVQQPTGHRLW